MSKEIKRFNYGHYSSRNYGYHTLAIDIGVVEIWFSYDTVVAFRSPKTGFHITQNCWGPTTGKHLNWINEDKSIREDGETFDKNLSKLLKHYRLEVS